MNRHSIGSNYILVFHIQITGTFLLCSSFMVSIQQNLGAASTRTAILRRDDVPKEKETSVRSTTSSVLIKSRPVLEDHQPSVPESGGLGVLRAVKLTSGSVSPPKPGDRGYPSRPASLSSQTSKDAVFSIVA
jgi:hypothetical protein